MRWIRRDALAAAMTMLAAARFRLAALVAAWAGALRHDPWAADVSLGQIADELRRLYPELQDDPAVAELVQLTAEAARLVDRGWP
jgi:hypothetical protein